MKMNIRPVPSILSTLALWSAVIALAILIGCSSTPPTAFEQKLFNVQTNYYPVLVVQTNTVTQTNTVVQVVQVTNVTGVITPINVTNTFTVPVVQVQTQVVQKEEYVYLDRTNGPASSIKGAAGVIGNLAAPGVGGPIATAVVSLILAGWQWVRSSKSNSTANNLAQTIETARELIKTLPNGSQIDTTLTTWMQQHQAEAGVLPQVLQILSDNVDNQAARQTADQLKAALAALQTPPKV